MKKTKILLNTFLLCFLTFGLFAQSTSNFLFPTQPNSDPACQGEQWCAMVSTDEINNNTIIADRINFTLSWDETLLSFDGFNLNVSLNELDCPIRDLKDDDFTITENRLVFDRFANDTICGALFELCWTIEEEINNALAIIFVEGGEIEFGGSRAPIGASAEFIFLSKPSVRIDNIVISSEHEQICMPVITDEFHGVDAAGFTLVWDETKLAFNSINLDNSDFDGLALSDFSTNITGQLGVSWGALNGEPIDLINNNGINIRGALMYKVCFDILTTDIGSISIDFIDDNPQYPAFVSNNCEENSRLITTGGELKIVDNAMSFFFPDSTISVNTEVLCIPTTAKNFRDIVSMQFAMLWDPEVLQFNDLKLDNSVLTNLNSFNFNPNENGKILMSWLDINFEGVDASDSAILFETCFDVIGAAGTETPLYLGGDTLGIITEVVSNELDLFSVLDEPGVIRIREEERFTLPGDANEDKRANHFDLLHIGLGYNAFGTERANKEIGWERKYSRDWGEDSPISKVNYKHSDTNGDSQVDRQDVEAIIQNWGEMEDVAGNGYAPNGYIGEASLLIDETAANLGQDILELPILLGTETMPTEGAYGIAFSISYEYDGGLAEEDWASILVEDSWLGTTDEDLISIYRHFPEQQRIDVALTRLDRIARGGLGKIATLSIVVEDLILLINQPQGGTSKTLHFNIHDVRLINENEQEIQVADSQISVQLDATTGLSILEDSAIRIYPTIANSRLHIASDETIEQAILLNVDGKQLDVIEHPGSTLNVASLENGMYLLHLITKDGLSIKKFSVVK